MPETANHNPSQPRPMTYPHPSPYPLPLVARGQPQEEHTMTPSQPLATHTAQTGRLLLSAQTPIHTRIRAVLIESGENLNGWSIPPEVLEAATELFSGRPCLLDHVGLFDYPSLRDLAATVDNACYLPTSEGGRIEATLRLHDTPAAALLQSIAESWLADNAAGLQVPPIGLSAVLSLDMDYSDDEHPVCTQIRKVWSVDAVLHPAAGGRLERFTNSVHFHNPPGVNTMPDQQTASEQPTAANADPLAAILEQMSHISQRIDALTPPARPEPVEGPARPEPVEGPAPTDLAARLSAIEASINATAHPVTNITPTNPSLRFGPTGLEQVTLALEAMLAGTRPPNGIPPLTGLRELYNLLSGDFDMTGVFNPDRVYLSNVTSSTMASITANVLNKRVANMFQTYPRWWEPISTDEDFASLQDVRWITLGGVGELPTVAEGASYTELTWDDNYQSKAFTKKGGYLGLTIEAIDKDDTSRLRAAPRALAQAAWLTIAKAVSAIFTANSGVGPTINVAGTTRALFHTDNANLGTTALSFAAYAATRNAMRQQTELSSGERLGALTAPRFLLVPPDLEVTALQILASAGEPGTADNDINPLAAGDSHNALLQNARSRVIVVDLWTDTNNWAAVADPQLYPSIGIGYRYGRAPEIFSVASPTAGLMFTNDTMPIKVRFFFAVGPIDHRGLYKHNVS